MRAVRHAQDIFGEAGSGAGRNASNVASLGQALLTRANERISALRDYQQALLKRLDTWELGHDGDRARTAEASLDLVLALTQGSASDRIAALADARIETSAAAMGAVMARAPSLSQSLRSSQWGVLDVIHRRSPTDSKSQVIADAMIAALNDDEHVTSLEQLLTAQHQLALQLIEEPVQPPPGAVVVQPTASKPTPAATPAPGMLQFQRRSASAGAIREALQQVEQALAADPELRADIDCRVYRPGADGDPNQ